MTINSLPSAPSPGDTPEQFNTKAFAFLAALDPFGTQANALATAVNADASIASTNAGIATTKASEAAASASTASTQAGIATGAATSAINAFDSFDDRYLGAKASDPITDNDGNSLLQGALYYRIGDGMRVWDGSVWVTAYLPAAGYATLTGSETLTNKILTNPSLGNSNVTAIKTATFNSQSTIATTTGAITIDWTTAQNQKQTEPTGTITYTFTAPPGPCHLQLIIDSDGTSTAQTINWPGTVIQYGATWAGANNKKSVINFWYDGTNYHMIGSNQV